MKTSFFLVVSSVCILASSVALAADPCDGALNSYFPKRHPGELLTTTKEVRLRSVCELREALLNQYSLIGQKERRIKSADGRPFDSRAMLTRCALIERETEDNSDILFLDRLRQCVAGFQDTHLSVRGRILLPAVTTGLLARAIDGKIYIAALSPEIIKYVKTSTHIADTVDFDDAIAIGNEILEIDGQQPATLAAQMATYINGSSADWVQSEAVRALFTRNFNYPTKDSVALKIRSAKATYKIALPWWAGNGANLREDAMAYFKQIGIPLLDRVRIAQNTDGKIDWRTVQMGYKGFLDSDPLFADDPFAPLIAYTDDSGNQAARMGEVNARGGARFCYLQLSTFSSDNLKAGTKPKPFVDVIRDFVGNCKARELDFVYDLRENGGGNGSYPAKVLAISTPAGASYGGKVIAFRATRANARMVSSLIDHPELSVGDLNDLDERSAEAISLALSQNAPYTSAIPWADVTADPQVGGYPGKVIALVTPNCISACDGMTTLLLRSGRATLIGTHSNGTGAGFMGSDAMDSVFRDSNLEFTLKMPNYLFGYSGRPIGSLEPMPFLDHEDEFFTENKPAVAQIQFQPSLSDLKGATRGWEDMVLAALKN